MADSLIQEILERIDESDKPISLCQEDIGKYSTDQLQYFLSEEILQKENRPGAYAVGSIRPNNGERQRKIYKSPPERFYRIDISRIREAIRKDNALKGTPQEFKGRLFELGEKRFRDMSPIKVYLSLRNQDIDWFNSICESIAGRPDNPTLLLVPRRVLVSGEDEERHKSRGLIICFLTDCLAGESWRLPWENVRSVFKAYSTSETERAIPGGPFIAPSGTIWRDVRITITDLDVKIEVNGIVKQYTYASAGFENRRENKPNTAWDLLNLFAIRGGILECDELRHRISVLRKHIRSLITDIDGDPIRLDGSRICYRTAFKIYNQEELKFPVSAGTRWSEVSIARVGPSDIRISFPVVERFAGSTYLDDSVTKTSQPEPAQLTTTVNGTYDLREMRLTDENGTTNLEGKALLDVLKHGGKVTRSANDNGMLKLGSHLCDLFSIESPAFVFSEGSSIWQANFEVSSEVK